MRPTIPTHLTDSQLVSELARCARDERGATALLVAHLAEMDARQLHLGAGFPSLFAYCREVLRLSESSTCNRIDVARAARRFPVILERLAEGSLSLASARLLAGHLTGENHRELIAAADGLGKRAVEEMLARRFPRPDVAPLVRKLPSAPIAAEPARLAIEPPAPAETAPPPRPFVATPPPRPLATPLSADRYQIRFTASADTWQKLRLAQDLLRHSVPNGDPAEIIDRALTALIADLARKKAAAVSAPRNGRATAAGSRHIPAKVRRAVWVRDHGRCAFVGAANRRCGARGFLEFHHVQPFGAGGATTVANVQLRCRAHNAYESVLFYGPAKAFRREDAIKEATATYGLSARDSTCPGTGTRRPG
jgi:hypothetical protein